MTERDKHDIALAIGITKTVGEAIRDAGEIPSGHLYAALCGYLDLRTYERIVETLKRSGLIRETGMHMLVWEGWTPDKK
jgi:hypothetical protein